MQKSPTKIYDRYTFDKSPEKTDGRVLVPSPHVKACDFLGFVWIFFSETLKFFSEIQNAYFPIENCLPWPCRIKSNASTPSESAVWFILIWESRTSRYLEFIDSWFFVLWLIIRRWSSGVGIAFCHIFQGSNPLLKKNTKTFVFSVQTLWRHNSQ